MTALVSAGNRRAIAPDPASPWIPAQLTAGMTEGGGTAGMHAPGFDQGPAPGAPCDQGTVGGTEKQEGRGLHGLLEAAMCGACNLWCVARAPAFRN